METLDNIVDRYYNPEKYNEKIKIKKIFGIDIDKYNNLINEKQVSFLDYEIVNSGNGDGWVLTGRDKKDHKSYESHLGNYSTLEQAKFYAVLYFMIARPEKFATHIAHYITGTGTSHEFFAFKKALEEENIPMPIEIATSNDMNFSILFNGKKLYKG